MTELLRMIVQNWLLSKRRGMVLLQVTSWTWRWFFFTCCVSLFEICSYWSLVFNSLPRLFCSSEHWAWPANWLLIRLKVCTGVIRTWTNWSSYTFSHTWPLSPINTHIRRSLCFIWLQISRIVRSRSNYSAIVCQSCNFGNQNLILIDFVASNNSVEELISLIFVVKVKF